MLRSLRKDTYHELLTCSWLKFSGFLILAFLGLNVFFSFIFVISDGSFMTPDHLRAYPRFIAGLFLSVQTLSTIGYGGMLPTSLVGEVVAAFESLIGLMFTALATGLIFARLSQPSAKILFAQIFLHTETDEGPALVFRIANARGNDIINAHATLNVIDLAKQSSKLKIVHIKSLKLRRPLTPTFYLNWTIVHDIDAESPLHGYTLEELTKPTMVYILNITGHDSSFNQMVFQYLRYRGGALRRGYFKDMIQINPETGEGEIILENLSALDERPVS